jgi:hypothetical protein
VALNYCHPHPRWKTEIPDQEDFAMRLPRSRFLRAILATLTFAILNLTTHSPAFSATATFVTFDVPGAGAGSYQGTSPSSINLEGEITGLYIDASSLAHGFLRSPLGFLTTFDAPGEINGTYPSSINLLGAVTGYYYDVNFVGHGFLRSSNGTFTTFDAPGAVAGMIGTFPSSINLEGTITGYYYDTNFVSHGFLRSSNGTFTTFDAPGAGTTTSPQGTTPEALNPLGVIAGIATDSSNFSNGFLRDSHGSFTTFDAPGSLSTFFPLSPFSFSVPDLSINLEGVTTGAYFQTISGNPFGGNYNVFVRAADGTFTTFYAADYPPCCIWSFPTGINQAGTIAGVFNDGNNINHGFVRVVDGTVTTFDVPGAGTGVLQGTVPIGIAALDVIMGFYTDTNNVNHGFLRIPRY